MKKKKFMRKVVNSWASFFAGEQVLISFLEITLSQKVEALMKIHAGKRLRPTREEKRASHPLAGEHTFARTLGD